jgi:endoglucanase
MRVAAAALLAVAIVPSVSSAAPPDVIRTGGPSRPPDAKVAVVASARNLAVRQFRVLDATGATVLRAKLRRAPGSAKPWKRAALADMSAVTALGSYRVAISRLRSRPWVVDDDAPSAAIAAMLQFFAANNDGNEPSPVHGPAHLNDAQIADGPYAGQHFDLTGGWMDAGDMLKFTQTIGHSAAVLQAAARLAPAQAPELNAAADVGVRWLVKAHPQPDLFIAQVGDQRDHEVSFRDPAGDDASALPGIGVRIAYPAVGSDLAGKAAAALAMAAQRTADPNLLAQARQWYEMGDSAQKPLSGLAGNFYVSGSWIDDMAAGAAELYRATGEQRYLTDALDYLKGAKMDAAFSWSEFAAFAAADLCGVLGAPGVPDEAARAQACGALAEAAIPALGRVQRDAFGMPADFGWGVTAESAASGLGAIMADRAGSLQGRIVPGPTPAQRLAAGARDYLLGRNPWGASFIVGYGPRSPRHPHHWASVFGPAKPVGAVVGGPAPRSQVKAQKVPLPRNVFNSARVVYTDNLENYVTSEPAIDYTADSILLLAALGR